MLFYTGKGDRGTSQVGNRKIPKDAPILSALGELDELNSFLGLVRSQVPSKSLSASLRGVQETLFIVQAQVAGLMFSGAKTPVLSPDKVR
ncbi:MAG: ATP:cob(I)alamin adenosyltransferase, partial [bacterium]|nr:ATP:cob(I)alamin adenosyltransferase [bacterium]